MANILLVEDDPVNARLFVKVLERVGGHRVTATEEVSEVLAQVSRGAADLVLLDVSLANCRYGGRAIDGIGIARLLKSQPETRTIPVILVTAHTMRGDGERFLCESGADGYVAKPVTAYAELLGPVTRLLAARAERTTDNGPRTTDN
jgi:CheY-like chemotaxis protein